MILSRPPIASILRVNMLKMNMALAEKALQSQLNKYVVYSILNIRQGLGHSHKDGESMGLATKGKCFVSKIRIVLLRHL